jgi:hypothetical protein
VVSTEYSVLTSGKLRTAPRGIPLMYKSNEAVVPKNAARSPSQEPHIDRIGNPSELDQPRRLSL